MIFALGRVRLKYDKIKSNLHTDCLRDVRSSVET